MVRISPSDQVASISVPLQFRRDVVLIQLFLTSKFNSRLPVSDGNGGPPDGLHSLLFKEEASPYAVLNVETAPRDGDVDVRVLIELTALSMEGTEYADLNALFTRPPDHCASCTAKQLVEQGPVVVEEVPQQVGHGKRMPSALVYRTLMKAYNLRNPPTGLVVHTDRGAQYTSKRFQALLSSYGLRSSMDDVGACWNNAVMERF